MPGAVTVGVVVVEGALVASLYAAHRRENGTAVVNAAVAIAATLVPVAVERALGVKGQADAFTPQLTLWIAVGGFLHVLGMLGLYESTRWWDHLTHTVSAALVASLLYAWTLAANLAPSAAVAATLAGTLALGAVWEGVELVARHLGDRYGIEPVLVHYGWRDTGFDMAFDAVGALLVVLVDLRTFVPVVETVIGAAG